jgi:hypothetical protein
MVSNSFLLGQTFANIMNITKLELVRSEWVLMNSVLSDSICPAVPLELFEVKLF